MVSRVGVAGGKAGQNAAASSHGLDSSTGEVVPLHNFHSQKKLPPTKYIHSQKMTTKREGLTIQIYVHPISCTLLLSQHKILVKLLDPVQLLHQPLVHL